MTDRPINLRAPHVAAIIAGRKTQHRIVLSPQPMGEAVVSGRFLSEANKLIRPAPIPWKVGDRLWVRETWNVVRCTLDYETGSEADYSAWDYGFYGDPRDWLHRDPRGDTCSKVFYAADDEDLNPSSFYPLIGVDGKLLQKQEIPWSPSIHMPRWASRFTLTVTDVRVQRLQDIGEADAAAEGARSACGEWFNAGFGQVPTDRVSPLALFAGLWDWLHGEGAWTANPWVSAISFDVTLSNIDSLKESAP